jgi:hypothetical protein
MTLYSVWSYNGRHEWSPMPSAALPKEKAEKLAESLRGSLHPGLYLTAQAFPVGVNPND